MNDHEHYCNNIPNFPIDKFFQRGKGLGKRVLIVGEAPAANGWRKSGRAFYTVDGKLIPAGRNLNKLLERYGITIEDCAFTELVKCYVGKDRKLLNECGAKCWKIFLRQIMLERFNLIILLGVKTLEIFNKEAGENLKTGELADISVNKNKYYVLPIYHPSPINPFNRQKNIEIFTRLNTSLELIIKKSTEP